MRVDEVQLGKKPTSTLALEVCAKQSILYQDPVFSHSCGECLQSISPFIVAGMMIGLALAALIYGAIQVARIFEIPRRAVGRCMQGFIKFRFELGRILAHMIIIVFKKKKSHFRETLKLGYHVDIPKT